MSLNNYVRDTRGELKHVSWPTRQQTVAFTTVVIVLSVIVGALLGFFDYIFAALLKLLIF